MSSLKMSINGYDMQLKKSIIKKIFLLVLVYYELIFLIFKMIKNIKYK